MSGRSNHDFAVLLRPGDGEHLSRMDLIRTDLIIPSSHVTEAYDVGWLCCSICQSNFGPSNFQV